MLASKVNDSPAHATWEPGTLEVSLATGRVPVITVIVTESLFTVQETAPRVEITFRLKTVVVASALG